MSFRSHRPDAEAKSGTVNGQPGPLNEGVRLLDVGPTESGVLVTLSDGRTLELAKGSLPASMPAIGEELPPPVLEDLVLAAERKQVARKIFALLDRRLRPLARLREMLTEQGYSDVAVEAVLARMEAEGIYSDRRYAEAYCRDCLLNRRVGRRYLVDKLRRKKVSADLARQVAEEILDPSTEAELARFAATEKWRRIGGHGSRRDLARVVRHLMGKGFDPGLANDAARRERPAARNEEAAD